MSDAQRRAADVLLDQRGQALSQTMYNCTVCGTQTPYLEAHTCRLTERNQRRFEAWKRSQQLPGQLGPSNCPDCHLPMPGPGQGGHACKGAPSSLAPGPIDEIAAQLRLAGYKITKESKP